MELFFGVVGVFCGIWGAVLICICGWVIWVMNLERDFISPINISIVAIIGSVCILLCTVSYNILT